MFLFFFCLPWSTSCLCLLSNCPPAPPSPLGLCGYLPLSPLFPPYPSLLLPPLPIFLLFASSSTTIVLTVFSSCNVKHLPVLFLHILVSPAFPPSSFFASLPFRSPSFLPSFSSHLSHSSSQPSHYISFTPLTPNPLPFLRVVLLSLFSFFTPLFHPQSLLLHPFLIHL